jgi:Flp pilus assembly protein TadD
MRRTVRILAALALLSLTPCDASAGWTALRSRNFLFIGDASERTIRATAQKLEQFREVMLRAIPGATATSPAPTVVLVFRNGASFQAYRPRFEGRPVDAAGLFLQNDDINYILVNAEEFEQAFKIVFHEYSHFLQGNWSEGLPVWVGEGMAEVYSTFQERDAGKSAVLGSPDRNHLGLLQTAGQLIPLRELIAIDRLSPTYNEGRRRGVLYAESWALVHYLMFGNDARRPQLTAFLSAIESGTNPEQAFGDAFGDIGALDAELKTYIRRFRFPVIRANFGEKVDGGTLAGGEAISEAQAAAYLNDVLARLGQPDAARAQLRGLIEKDAALARGLCVLGLIELRDKRYGEALPLLERAAALAPDDAWIQTALGDALIRRSEDPDGDARALLQHARESLARAADRDDASARTLATFGRAHLYEGGDPHRAFSALERAVTLVPGREEYHLLLGHALVLQGDYTRAAAQLGPLVARAREPEIRDYALRLLGEISRAQSLEMNRVRDADTEPRRAGNAEASAGSHDDRQPPPQAADPGRPPDAPERTGATTLDARAGSRSRRMGSLPVLREVRAGETRVLGFFSFAECGKDGVVLGIESDRRVVRLSARSFGEVDFISYRKDGPSGVSCGDQRPLFPVLATFRASDRAGSGVDGTAVAIEVVEDDYLPQ